MAGALRKGDSCYLDEAYVFYDFIRRRRYFAVDAQTASGQTAQLRGQLKGQLDQQLSSAIFQAFSRDVQVRSNPQVDQNAVTAVLNSFQ